MITIRLVKVKPSMPYANGDWPNLYELAEDREPEELTMFCHLTAHFHMSDSSMHLQEWDVPSLKTLAKVHDTEIVVEGSDDKD
jgi:hypothetical protein